MCAFRSAAFKSSRALDTAASWSATTTGECPSSWHTARTVALLAKADTVAAKRFEVAYNRYVIGRITLDNLYIGQSEKDQALMQFVNGLRDYWGSYYRLRQVTLFDFVTGQPIR